MVEINYIQPCISAFNTWSFKCFYLGFVFEIMNNSVQFVFFMIFLLVFFYLFLSALNASLYNELLTRLTDPGVSVFGGWMFVKERNFFDFSAFVEFLIIHNIL